MNFLQEKGLELDGIDQKLAGQIATIMRHQLRVVLTNDLGLSRQAIRDEASELIQETLKRHAQNFFHTGAVEKLIQSHIAKQIASLDLRKLVNDELNRQVRELLADKVKITIN